MGLDRDFIFAGEPTNSHKKQALGYCDGFDEQRKCSRAQAHATQLRLFLRLDQIQDFRRLTSRLLIYRATRQNWQPRGAAIARKPLRIEALQGQRILIEMFLSLRQTRCLLLPFNDPALNSG